MNINKKSITILKAAFWVSLFFVPLATWAATDDSESSDPSLLTPEIEREMDEYSAGLIADNTFESEFTETLPFFNDQFNQFEIDFGQNNKRSYRAGERLDIAGKISFSSSVENGYLDFKRNCLNSTSGDIKSRCLLSPTYFFDHHPETGLFVQVWQRDKDEKGALNGDYLIDEFYVLNGIDLNKGTEKDFAINWKTPSGMNNGDYYLTFSILNNQSFELFGTPLLASAPKKIYDFKIVNGSEARSGVAIDKNEIKINGLPYSLRAPAPEISPAIEDETVNIEVPIVGFDQESKASLRYELYKWGQTNPRDLLDSKEESKIFKANERFNANYRFTPNELESVYNLRITAKTDNSVSTSNVRFVIKNKAKGVFRFLSLAQDISGKYPFFCLKNANWSGIFQGTVKIELKDSIGNLINSAEQKANIRPETRCFIALDNRVDSNECLTLKGQIFNREGKTVDEKEFSLPCGNDKGSRVGNTLKKISDSVALKENKNRILIFVFILFILIGGFIYLNNKKKNNEN